MEKVNYIDCLSFTNFKLLQKNNGLDGLELKIKVTELIEMFIIVPYIFFLQISQHW